MKIQVKLTIVIIAVTMFSTLLMGFLLETSRWMRLRDSLKQL